jgi:uncharacterized cysteine cluster protein YcgN (CxxCxxCC family)
MNFIHPCARENNDIVKTATILPQTCIYTIRVSTTKQLPNYFNPAGLKPSAI